MRIQPDGINLLDTVSTLLREQLLPAVKAEHGYEIRMALNALGIARRQLARGESAQETEREAMAALMEMDAQDPELERHFARQVRAGIVEQDPSLQALLWHHTLERVRESAPRYLRQEGLE